jgi:hypothetical protein
MTFIRELTEEIEEKFEVYLGLGVGTMSISSPSTLFFTA